MCSFQAKLDSAVNKYPKSDYIKNPDLFSIRILNGKPSHFTRLKSSPRVFYKQWDLNTELVWYLNGRKEVGCQMVQYSNDI